MPVPCAQFENGGFRNLSLADINKYLPDEWKIDQNFLDTFDAANSGTLRDIGTYEYDAVAAFGLLACQLAPTGPLPDSFGTDIWNTKEHLDFHGLSNNVRFSEIGNRHSETSTYPELKLEPQTSRSSRSLLLTPSGPTSGQVPNV